MKQTIIDKIEKNIRDIDEPAIIIVNHQTYQKIKKMTPNFSKFVSISLNPVKIFGIPLIVENIKEDCIVLPKKSVEMIKKIYENENK